MSYLIAPRWRGTSPVMLLPSSPQIRAGLGELPLLALPPTAAATLPASVGARLASRPVGAVPCNWIDGAGNCATPRPGDTLVTPSGNRVTIGSRAARAVAGRVLRQVQGRGGVTGLGLAITSGDPSTCNWVDDFGNCITPTAGDTVVTPGGLRLTVGSAGSAPKPASSSGATEWLNKNAGNVAIGAGVLVALSLLIKAAK